MLGAAPFLAQPVSAQTAVECAVLTPERQARKTPEEALLRLVEGNRRFVDGYTVNCDLMAQAHETATQQSPAAAIVGCIDSRVPPELIFDQRIGDVFTARVAGNFVNSDILGSLEFATKVSGAKAVVVLGHTACGAIRSAMAGVEMGNITGMLENIRPALAAVTDTGETLDPSSEEQMERVTAANVRLAMEAITTRSDIMRGLVEAGDLKIAGAIHDLATGKVDWLA